ncbi:MAG: hypothetical protein GX451_11565 [Acholeplasmataceae bacterium]|nr:hypothetical protein [Acholeplasmataceae bacterium]
MKAKILQKSVGIFLAICFSLGLVAAPVLAKPQSSPKQVAEQNHNNHEKNKKFEQDQHRKEIVRKVQNCTSYSFERARDAHMTLEDFIITLYIADQLTDHDFMDIYWMQKNGSPYKEICKANGIKWGWVRRHVKNQHMVMSEEAREAGLIMWALDEILH